MQTLNISLPFQNSYVADKNVCWICFTPGNKTSIMGASWDMELSYKTVILPV